MSTLPEVNRVISVKYQCHEATMSPNVTQKSSLADVNLVPSGHIVASHFRVVIRFAGICYGQYMDMR